MCSEYGKKDFAEVIKLRDLKDYPGLSRWTQCNHKEPHKTENSVTREVEGQRETGRHAVGFEGGG